MKLSNAYKWETSMHRTLEKMENRFYDGYQFDETRRTWKINGIQYEFTMSRRNEHNERVCKIVMKTGKTGAETQLKKVITDKELTMKEAWDFCFGAIYLALEDGRWFTFDFNICL